MRSTIRGRWRRFARLSGANVVAALSLVVVLIGSGYLPGGIGPTALYAARPNNAARSSSSPARSNRNVSNTNVIVVNSSSTEPERGRVDLAQAIALAAQDSRNSLIEFDPTVFAKPTTIVLSQPIMIIARAGNVRIEGPTEPSSDGSADDKTPLVTIDASACPDAGIVCGGNATLTLSNVIFKGGQQRAILIKDKGRVLLENVHVQSPQGPGVVLFGASKIDMKQCSVRQSQTHGIEVHGTSVADLKSVEITGSDQSGVAGFDQATITADSCQFDRNGHWNVVLTGQSQVRLSNCTLSGAQFANLDASDSARVELRNCRIEKGQRFGLFITGNSELDIAGSSICKHANRGIEMQNIASLRIASTSVSENGDYGVILFERSRIKATECNFARNGGHGVSLRNQASGLFEQCEFSNNRFSGLGCLDAHDGGVVRATQCAFHGNGMRPIYRGPLHLDPLVPTPLTIDDLTVTCLADPRASVELYLDRVGEASHYLRTIQADSRGRFRVSRAEVPEGYVMTAAATVDGATSEFNVIAGSSSADVIGALLARTGPLSDIGGRIDLDGDLRRWRTGTRLILYLPDPPSVAVQQYAQFFASHVSDWTCGAVRAELNTAAVPPVAQEDTIVVSVRYVPADSNQLLGRGGVTIMKWDLQGYFVDPMKILLASCKDADETCPRVLAHEFGHVLGLCHVRVGLLSRMQGSTPPSSSFVNDFSPTLTFYDVLALHTLHSPEIAAPATLRQVAAAGSLPPSSRNTMASAVQDDSDHVTYSPSADNSSPDQQNTRPTQRFRQPN